VEGSSLTKRGQNESGDVRVNVLEDRIIEVSNQFESLQFDLATGKYSVLLRERKGSSIRNALSRVLLSDGERVQTSDRWVEKSWKQIDGSGQNGPKIDLEVTFKGADKERLGNFTLLFSAELFARTPIILLRLQFTNDTGKPVGIKEFQPLVIEGSVNGSFSLGSSIKNWRFLKNGYHTSSPCYSLSLTELDKTCPVEFFRKDFNPHSKLNPIKGEFDSEWMTAFKDNATGNSTVIGFVTMNDNMCQIDFKVDREENEMDGLWTRSFSDDVVCKNGDTIRSEKVLIDLLGPLPDGLDRYADRVASEMNAVPSEKVPTGWCSWYEFFEQISEELIVKIADYYHDNIGKYPIEYIQVDDGYFTYRGDWTTPNDKFPHGMKFVAEKIKEAGLKPAIWLAPFDVSTKSELFREHPDWLVKDEKGKPVEHDIDMSTNRGWCGLDCTNPSVIEWLKSLFRTVTEDWGYEHVKLDFLYSAATDGVRHDRNITRAQALRRGLKAIREAVGDNIRILGCLAPLGLAVGLVNSYRINPDNATKWKAPWPFDNGASMRDAMRNAIFRYFMHNKFWVNDPDCVIVRRGKERSEFPKDAEIEYMSKGGTISEDEVRFELTVMGLLGGSVFYSDDPFHLPPEREKYLPILLPSFQRRTRIIDLLEDPLPRILNLKIQKEYGNWDLVGLLNWSDSPEDMQLDFSRLGLKKEQYYHVFSFWDEKYLGKIRDKLTVSKMPAHSASLLSIREVLKRPQLVSSTIHVTQGGPEVKNAEWKDKERILKVELTHPGKRSGKLFIYVPQSFKFTSATPKDVKVRVEKTTAGDSLLVLEISFEQSTNIAIKFE
jgi:alpha-galactosidase